MDLEEEFELAPVIFGTETPCNVDNKDEYEDVSKDGDNNGTSKTRAQKSSEWFVRAGRRKELIDHYLWNEDKGFYFDYDTVKRKQINYESVTCFWGLWAGVSSDEQAKMMMYVSILSLLCEHILINLNPLSYCYCCYREKALPKFEVRGGLVSGSRESVGDITLNEPNRQWE